MAGITTTVGPFSGLDTGSIIDKLMTVEKQPYDRLETKKTGYNNEISAYGQISSSLSELQKAVAGLSSKNISTLTAKSSNENVLKATASTTASPGQYTVRVNKVAQEQKAISQVFSSDTATFKTGTLTVGNGGHTTSITIDYRNNTLTGIRDAINRSATDVSASIINDGSGYKLIVSTKNGGAINGLQITGTSDGPTGEELSSLSFDSAAPTAGQMSLLQTGSDASFTIDGLTITSHSNTVTNVLKGVTLNLQTATSASTIMLSIGQDAVSSSAGMKTFVESYNKAITKLKELSVKGQPLNTEQAVRSVQNALRPMLTTYVSGATSMLAQFGVIHEKDGTLSIDAAKMDKAVGFNQVGFNKLLDAMSDKFTKTSTYSMLTNIIRSTISSRTDTLQSTVKRIENDQANMQRQLDKKQTAYVKQFTKLEQTIAQLQSQSSSIATKNTGG